jgi:hypothetical protein
VFKLSSDLGTHPSVTRVLRSVEFSKGDYLVDMYFEVYYANGEITCYWLELSCSGDRWIVRAHVTINRPDEREPGVLQEFPPRITETLDGLAEHLHEAVSDLVATSQRFHPRG